MSLISTLFKPLEVPIERLNEYRRQVHAISLCPDRRSRFANMLLTILLLFGTLFGSSFGVAEDFQDLNLSFYEKEIGEANPHLSRLEVKRLSQKTFYYVYFKRTNFASFVVRPKPELVLEKIAKILDGESALEVSLSHGVKLITLKAGVSEQLKTVEQIKNAAEEILDAFNDCFVQKHHSRYSAIMRLPAGDLPLFSLYLHQIRKARGKLSEQVSRYFFKAEPRTVSLSEMEDSSGIVVLAKVMIQLSDIAKERLED